MGKKLFFPIFLILTTLWSTFLTDACDLTPSVIALSTLDNVTGVFWTGSIGEGTVENPRFDSYSDLIEIEVTLTSEGSTTKIELSPGPAFSDFLDINRPENQVFSTIFGYDCKPLDSDETVEYFTQVAIEFEDGNNRRPTFNVDELPLKITTDWDTNIALNWHMDDLIRISDLDYTEENANFQLRTNPPLLNFTLRQQWTSGTKPSSFDTDIQVFLTVQILTPGIHDFQIFVSDDDFATESVLTIKLEVELVNVDPPKFTANSYHLKLNSWPRQGDSVDLDPTIYALDPDDLNTEIEYSLTGLDFLTITPGTNPPEITFNSDVVQGDFDIVVIGEIEAKEVLEESPKSSLVPLIIEFPRMR